METVTKRFNLDPKTTTYAVCPSCHYNYEPISIGGSSRICYPDRCNQKLDPDPESDLCNTPLLDAQSKPVKTFIYRHFHDYLGGLLARGDIENLMDESCDKLMSEIRQEQPPPMFVKDVFEANFIRTFRGPGTEPHPWCLFIERPINQGRYTFAFHVDYFSTEGSTVRGTSASSGLLAGACLNLPMSIRYQDEFMYIAGVISGPDEPKNTALNNYLRPVVTDMADSWDRGVKYSRTANYPSGKLTHSAIIVDVSDLPAARQTSQTANHNSHHYCSVCHCYHKSTRCNTDIHDPKWRPKDPDILRAKAEAWRNASSRKDQEKIFSANGMRWSELWRLPYWDPSRMLVVNSMHCLLEGVAHLHFRKILKLTELEAETKVPIETAFEYQFSLPDEDNQSISAFSENDLKHIPLIHAALVGPITGTTSSVQESLAALKQRLEKRNKSALEFVAKDLNLSLPSNWCSKAKLAEMLVTWVSILLAQFFWATVAYISS